MFGFPLILDYTNTVASGIWDLGRAFMWLYFVSHKVADKKLNGGEVNICLAGDREVVASDEAGNQFCA